jgi:hypothetical protein
MKQVKIWQGTTKGEIMRIAYNNDAEKLRNVDSAIPQDWLNENKVNSFWYVTDYNKDTIFGAIRNLKDVAKENGIELSY